VLGALIGALVGTIEGPEGAAVGTIVATGEPTVNLFIYFFSTISRNH
jgi:hypothetical protein